MDCHSRTDYLVVNIQAAVPISRLTAEVSNSDLWLAADPLPRNDSLAEIGSNAELRQRRLGFSSSACDQRHSLTQENGCACRCPNC